MRYLCLAILFAAFSCIFCESPTANSVFEGDDYKYSLDFDGGEKAIGVKRHLYRGEDWQFYYFCEKAKGENKKKCGAWVDKKGNKLKDATNKVTLKGKEAIISKVTLKDRGAYTGIFENENDEPAATSLVVETRPPPPPPKY